MESSTAYQSIDSEELIKKHPQERVKRVSVAATEISSANGGHDEINWDVSNTRTVRSIRDALGVFGIVVILAGTAILFACLTFLVMLWHAAAEAVEGGRVGSFWVRLPLLRFVNISTYRAVPIPPERFLYEIVGQDFDYSSSWPFYLLLTFTFIASAVLQFSSTILIRDFGKDLPRIRELSSSREIAFGIFRHKNLPVDLHPYVGINYWKSNPTQYPRFAEYGEDPMVADGLDDTGIMYRAFLPFVSSEQRETLRQYNGPTTVVDSRVVCVRPVVEIHHLKGLSESRWTIQGLVQLAHNQPMLMTTLDPLKGARFNCTFVGEQSEQTNKRDWMISLCTFPSSGASGLGFLKPSIQEGKYVDDALPGVKGFSMNFYTRAHLLINITGTASELRSAFKKMLPPKTSDFGVWTTKNFQPGTTKASFTMCFSNPLPFDYDVDISARADSKEPRINKDNTTTSFDASQIAETYVRLSNSSLDNGRLLKLEAKKNWTIALTEITKSIKTVNFIEASLSKGLRNNNDDSSNSEPSVILGSYCNEDDGASSIHRVQVSIFQQVLQKYGPARAVQTLFTILMQMSYYDMLPLFDVTTFAEWENTRAVKIPSRKTGLKFIHAIVILHLILLFLTSALFLLWTRSTMLGNIWQAVSQTITHETESVFLVAGMKTDRQIRKQLEANGEGRKRIEPQSTRNDIGDALELRRRHR